MKAFITGKLSQDCEVKTVGQNVVIKFSVPFEERVKSKAGDYEKRVTWVNCEMWKPAENHKISQYLLKGQIVAVEGVPSAYGYTGKDGQVKAVLTIKCTDIRLFGSVQAQEGGVPRRPAQAPTPPAPTFDDSSDLPF